MITGVNVPLEVAVMLSLAALTAGIWAGHNRAIRRLDPRLLVVANPLQVAAQHAAVDLAARRNAVRAESQAVMRVRIDQLTSLKSAWDGDTREEVLSHVAAVMRAGLRRDDRFAVCDTGSITITIPGADERTAARIADRLRRSLAQLRLPHLGGAGQVTASFGVAADRHGETGDILVRRARQALEAAMLQGHDHVVTASEVDEVMLLPPPAASAA